MASLFAHQLEYFVACKEAIKWVGDKEFEEAWTSCGEINWMLWLANKLTIDPKLFIQIACRCARLVLHLIPEEEERPRKAVEAAETWLAGRASNAEAQVAALAAWDVADAAARTDAAEVARAAAWAAEAAAWADTIALAAGSAAKTAEAAARVTGNNDIKSQILSIIREVLTQPVREKLSKINP